MRKYILVLILPFMVLTTVYSQCYELYFENESGAPHYGYLTVYQNNTAEFTVKFPDGYGGWSCVYQYGNVVNYGYFKGAEFYNPTICGTSIRNPYYAADNLYWGNDTYGNLYLYNFDDRAVLSGTWIKLVYCN